MQPDEARDEQFKALLTLVPAGCTRRGGLACGRGARGRGGLDEVHECVVEEHSVACGAVDDAVENVGYDFTLDDLGRVR